jgi:cytochrome c5
MPARGGNTELPDDVVNAAAEYMLEQTFPDRAED